MILSRLKSGLKRKKHYNSLYKMPIYNWFKMRLKKDFSYLIKDSSKHDEPLSEEQSAYFESIYLDMLTEFIEEFGQSKSLKNELETKSKIIDLNLEFLETGDKFILNSIENLTFKMLKKQTDEVNKSLGIDEKKEMKKEIATVSKTLGKPIDIKAFPVIPFYTQLTIQDAL